MADEQAVANVTPGTFLEFYREVSGKKRALEEAQGGYRAALKRAKAAGIDQAALTQAMQMARQDTAQVELHYRNVNRYLSWLGSPLGTQGALFGAHDDVQPTEKATQEQREWDAEDAGYLAGKGGEPVDNCPHVAGSPFQVKWLEGWHKGQAVLVEQLGSDGTLRKGRRKKANNPEDRPAA